MTASDISSTPPAAAYNGGDGGGVGFTEIEIKVHAATPVPPPDDDDRDVVRAATETAVETDGSGGDDEVLSFGLPAVECRGLRKTFGRGKGATKALDNVNMNVEQGSIYGLLGPSGCGKTTLLSCIVGRLRCDAGTVRVFGEKPGDKNAGVPGSLVGYMPQEIALLEQFTIEETLLYFGRIHGMPMEDIKHRTEFLVGFLGLPSAKRMVENLSGGQKRRVSLACALLQKPKLLILDEPTVGVDPLLRFSIWCHLVHLAKSEGTSVIVTTHYIEEARQANRVGMMRNGQILAEASPESLLARYRLPTLEDVFLRLCQSIESTGGWDNSLKNLEELGFLDEHRKKMLAYANKQQQGDAVEASAPEDHSRLSTPQDSASMETLDIADKDELSNISVSSRNGVHPSSYLNVPLGAGEGKEQNGKATFSLGGEDEVSPPREEPGGSVSGKTSRRQENMISTSCHFLAVPKDAKVMGSQQGLFHGKDERSVALKRRNRSRYLPSCSNLKALIIKNLTWMFRHIGGLTFELLLPPLQILLFCLTVYSDPKHLGLAVFNEETNYTSPYEATCDALMFSCKLVDTFRTENLDPLYYPSMEEANRAVLDGKAWGAIHIHENFSMALLDRAIYGVDVTNNTVALSRVEARLDMTNQQLAFIVVRELMQGFQRFFEEMLAERGYNPNLAAEPIMFGEPLFGIREPLATEFVAPGMLVMISFFMALGLTAMAFVLEKKEGLLYRSFIAGVKSVEMLICFLVTQAVVLFLQTALTLIVMLAIFNVPNRGSIIIVWCLCFCQGICGMSFGLLISSFFSDETSTIVACLGAFLPTLLLSGMCWPREGMWPALNILSGVLPQTFGTDALRAVMSKGSGLGYFDVYMGFLVPSVWTIVQLGLCSLVAYFKEGF